MSADLLAEFDSFYQAPQQKQSNLTPASNDLSFLGGTGSNTQVGSGLNSSQWQESAAKPNDEIWGGMTEFPSATISQQSKTSQEDIWGSFEEGNGRAQAQQQIISQSNSGEFIRDASRTVPQNKPGIVQRPNFDLFSSNINEHTTPTSYNPPKPATRTALPPRPVSVTKSSFGEVLFDADDIPDDDDEFGDFETGTSQSAVQPEASQSLTGIFGATTPELKLARRPPDILSTTATSSGGKLPYHLATKSPSIREITSFPDSGLATKQTNETKKEVESHYQSPLGTWATYESKVPKPEPHAELPAPNNADEDWGDFADLPPEPSAVQFLEAVSGTETDAWGWDTADQVSNPTPEPAATSVDTAPPTNIPPPSVLLALFPALFDLPHSALFRAVANQPFSLKNRIISDPSTIDFLRGYLLIATVAARLIAGRKFRWKRDTLLSQAMRIGPAAAGGKGGMKLAGVDKAEITREDREAADVVRVWKEQLGHLRSAIAVANSSMHDNSAHLAIPDISENLYVKTQDGGLSAPRPCIICGLKREERINKVDLQVEDSFGEWWVEHWGHRACRNFWLEHEPKLKTR
ncbi:hypothetical protein D0Z07_1321 [Hyphodiscus hymeniophilus]|uniref:Serine/threonine-protein kinase ppk6 n=1 Tax=Hyphodiscus hymeniophilus TaxID=353542 RepID=A0A9P6VQ70_9HELO|nr:hypothetical protein D0Z07_1321 [Hyphodiscus hymeniophilus]